MFENILSFHSVIPNTGIDGASFAVCIGAAALLGIVISLCFRYRGRSGQSLLLTVAVLPLIVTVIGMLVGNRLGAGIAVAGTFSLVRFRSQPGTAREIAAVFTSVAIGLALGMGYVLVAVIFFLFAGALTLILTSVDFGSVRTPQKELRITLPENFDYEGLFDDLFEKYTKKAKLERVRTINMGTLFELTYHVIFKEAKIPKEFLDDIRSRNGNLNVSVSNVIEQERM